MEHRHMIDIVKDFNDELDWSEIELSPSIEAIRGYDLHEATSAKIPSLEKWSLRNEENRFKSSRMDSPYYRQSYKEKKEEEDTDFINKLELLDEKQWQHKIPKSLARDFANVINSDDPDFEEARRAMKNIVEYVQNIVGEDDFYETGLLEDLEFADLESEEDVDYYINEMYDVLDGYSFWMDPPMSFDESNRRVREDSSELEIIEESSSKYASLFKRFLKGVGFDKTGSFAEKDTPYSGKGFEWESQVSKLKCTFDPETGFWYVSWLDYDDPECSIRERGRGFNNLIQFFFDLPGSTVAIHSSEPAEYYFEESFVDSDESNHRVKESHYRDAFAKFLKDAELDTSGPFGDKPTVYSERGFTWNSQVADLRVTFDPSNEGWTLHYKDEEDPELNADVNGFGFNKLIDCIFDHFDILEDIQGLNRENYYLNNLQESNYLLKNKKNGLDIVKESIGNLSAKQAKGILEKLFLNTKEIFKNEILSSDLTVDIDPRLNKVSVYEVAKFKDGDWPIITSVNYDVETGDYEWESKADYPRGYDGRNGNPYWASGYGTGFGQLLEDLADEIGLRGVKEYAGLDPEYQGKYKESLVHDVLDDANIELQKAKKSNEVYDTVDVEDRISVAQNHIRKAGMMVESEGSPKIAGTWEDILEGLREDGFEVSEYYSTKPRPWIMLRKDGRDYEAEVTRYFDGSYELIKRNIAILPEGR